MNFGAHVLVAARLVPGATTGVLLGAAGPDLAGMGRLPLAAGLTGDLGTGVAIHHRTDAVFHDLAWFREQNRALSAALQAAGVRRGPARGAAHVVVELLLDGALLAGRPEPFGRAWAALAEPSAEAVALAHTGHEDRWRGLLAQLTARLEPERYADPDYAAERTAGALGRRPRLALTDDEVDVLRHEARRRAPAIAESAPTILQDVPRMVGGVE